MSVGPGSAVRRAVRRGAALAVLACTVGLGIGVGVASPAQAAGELCSDRVVYDGAGVLDDKAIAQTARASFGDDVVVKVIAWDETPGSGDLYDALVDARYECGGWGFTGGGEQSLLVLGVSVGGRELGSHYDGAAFDQFDHARDDVEGGLMGPSFGNGRWTQGMVDGLHGYGDAYASPVPTSAPDPFSDGDGGDGDVDVDGTSTGSGSEALLWVLGVPVGLAAAGGAGVGGVRLRRRLKARSAARASLGSAVNDMAQAWFELDESNELIDARVKALPAVTDSVADAIRAAHAEAVLVRTGATDLYLRLSELHTSTAIVELDTDEATTAKGEVEVAARALREAQVAMGTVESQLSAYDVLREELPGRVAGLRDGAAEIGGLLAARRSEGFRTDDNDPAPQAAEQAAVAVSALATEQRFGDADAALDRAEVDLDGHRTWLTELAAFRAALVRDTEQLRARAAQLDVAVADAYVTTEDLERDQDPSCVEGIRATVDVAAGERKALDGQLTTIEQRSSMATQQFTQARQEITEAEQAVESIAAGAASPALRVEALRALAVDLPQRAERAVVEADAIQGQITTHPAAMTFLSAVPEVSTLRTTAATVGDDVTQPRPPYLGLDERLVEAEAGLTRARAIVDQGIAAHEESQRALDNAASAVAAAQGEVSDSDASGDSRRMLAEAQGLLADAEAETGSLAEITSGAAAAKSKADAAAARARQDRRDADQRREAARRAAAARRRSSSGGGGSSFRGGGGGSRGGGSRSSGGGGSRGFSGGGGSRRSGGGGSRGF